MQAFTVDGSQFTVKKVNIMKIEREDIETTVNWEL